MKRFTFFISLFSLLLIGFCGYRLFLSYTDGFSLELITPEFKYRENWTHPEQTLSITELQQILSQPFSYLGKGSQIYAFLSHDGKYVLKLVKQKHLRLNACEDFLCSLPFMHSIRQKKLDKREYRVKRILTSSSIAFNDLQKETGLFYLHLLPTTDIKIETQITDSAERLYTLYLDQFEFMLQPKADAMIHALSKLNESEKKIALKNLLAILVQRSKKGVRETDRHLLGNIGFIETTPLLIDVGRFAFDSSVVDSTVYFPLIKEELEPLEIWLKEMHPTLHHWFTQKLADI